MSKIVVQGGSKLEGEIKVQGAKNSALPILAATILNKSKVLIHDCPNILDVQTMNKILEDLGCEITWENNDLLIDPSTILTHIVPEGLVREMRSSIILMGSIIGRCKEVLISYPGGCSIGHRPIDLHLKALKQLGVKIYERHGYIYCCADRIVGNKIILDFPSVGATENIMLAAVLGEGQTIIRNAAMEPEIVDLQNFLNSMGAKVRGAGTDLIVIDGVESLHEAEFVVMPDRIVAGTYMMAAAVTRSNIVLRNVETKDMSATLAKLREMNCSFMEYNDAIKIITPKILKSVDIVRTQTHPGFATDMQAQMMAALATAYGTSIITETIFESRYKHVEEMVRMGADITLAGRTAIIKGVTKLTGAEVKAKDLRGGAALVIAALGADGESIIHEPFHILRGYEDICADLCALGADAKFIEG